jgi:hypothetical protein
MLYKNVGTFNYALLDGNAKKGILQNNTIDGTIGKSNLSFYSKIWKNVQNEYRKLSNDLCKQTHGGHKSKITRIDIITYGTV